MIAAGLVPNKLFSLMTILLNETGPFGAALCKFLKRTPAPKAPGIVGVTVTKLLLSMLIADCTGCEITGATPPVLKSNPSDTGPITLRCADKPVKLR